MTIVYRIKYRLVFSKNILKTDFLITKLYSQKVLTRTTQTLLRQVSSTTVALCLQITWIRSYETEHT